MPPATTQTTHKAHVADWKFREVAGLVELVRGHGVTAVVNIAGIPSPQLQAMRKRLRGAAEMRAGKNNLFRLALLAADKERGGVGQLEGLLDGQVALVFSKDNPFKLFKKMEATKQRVAAKGGEKAPDDIWVRKAETPFKPGPVVGELQKAGIPAAIDAGKVVIKSDKLLVKRGAVISRELALALAKLEIFPVEIGLDLRGAFEDGILYKPEVLRVSDEEFRATVGVAVRGANELAFLAGWVTKRTIEPMLTRAYRQTIALAMEAKLVVPETVKPLFARAHRQMVALAKLAKGEALDPELQAALGVFAAAAPAQEGEEKKEEKKEEKVSEEEAAAGLGSLFGD